MSTRERETGGEWRCPRDRGRRGDLEDALGADKRANSDVQTPRVQTRGVTGELLPTDAASIQTLNPTKARSLASIIS